MLLVILILSLTIPAYAKKSDTHVMKIPYRFDAKPPWAVKPEKDRASIEILNIPKGETVTDNVMVIVEAKGASQVLLTDEPMTAVGYGDRFHGSWTYSGTPVIEVTALDTEGNEIASDTVNVNVVEDTQWTIYLEIDYVEGHYPSVTALSYLTSYWAGFAVDLQYTISDKVTDPTSGDGYISTSDFWAIEKTYNHKLEFDDRAQDGFDSDQLGYDAEYMIPEKWVLWGSWDSNPNVGGYTYVVIDKKDGLAGNYIFIADAMIDQWEASNNMYSDNGEVIVTCHEIGHSLGILKLRGSSEKYDPDYYSIMSTMRIENAKYMEDAWYYSSAYWDTKNLEYY